MIVLYAGVGAALLSAFFVALYLPLARRCGWVDTPNARSAHARSTPNSGGIAVVAAVLLALFIAVPALPGAAAAGVQDRLTAAAAALMFICAIGAWDDRRHLSARFRLSCFFVVATALVWQWLDPDSPMGFAITALVTVALVWVMNLYNFMDGLDGLAGLQTAAVAAGLLAQGWFFSAPPLFTVVVAVVGGAYLGFLAFNWPPARLFMGDAGSLSAGLLIGVLGIWGWQAQYLAPEAWCLLMSPFVLDASVTLIERILRRERLAEAHSDHFYQHLARRWGGHRRVVLALALLHVVWLQPLALACALFPGQAQTFFIVGLFPQLFLLVRKASLK
jgi:Fuc2NAc and GlcNAc transferase